LILVIWFGVVFLFFTAAVSKLATYVLPLFPAAALLVGVLWNDLLTERTRGLHAGVVAASAFMAAIFLLGSAYVLVHPPAQLTSNYGVDAARIQYLVFAMAGGTLITCVLFCLRRDRTALSILPGLVLCSILYFLLAIVPSINPYRSTKVLAQEMDRLLPAGEEMVHFHRLKDSALFYTDRKVKVLQGREALETYMVSNRRVFCILEREDFETLHAEKSGLHVLMAEGNKLLISNRASRGKTGV
jgi:4-amino-4-deoxy-L-arabinose transferase-like glycosyltransferase